MVSFLLAVNLILMSDRAHFWDSDKISHSTQIIENGEQLPVDFNEFRDKNVLLLVHGFNSSGPDALARYNQVRDQIAMMMDLSGNQLYDVIIGYLWAGAERGIKYFSAEKHADKLSLRMRTHLENLSSVTTKLDLMAHSLGNRLVLDALSSWPQLPSHSLINNYYSLAPAVDNESIELDEKYGLANKHFQNMYVFHSKRDDVLKFLYLFADHDRALGYDGAEHPQKAPMNIQFVDCTEFVDGHSAYFTSAPFYSFIQQQQLYRTPPSSILQNARLLMDGFIVPRMY